MPNISPVHFMLQYFSFLWQDNKYALPDMNSQFSKKLLFSVTYIIYSVNIKEGSQNKNKKRGNLVIPIWMIFQTMLKFAESQLLLIITYWFVSKTTKRLDLETYQNWYFVQDISGVT